MNVLCTIVVYVNGMYARQEDKETGVLVSSYYSVYLNQDLEQMATS